MRALVRLLLCVAFFAVPSPATWSILIVDLATGEVAIGIATCLTGFDLRPNTVVVVPGIGVAAAQSFVGSLSLRELIRTELIAGTPPAQILALLAAADPGHQSRQYGIADAQGRAVTFTGTGAGPWAGGLNGQTGTLVYTVQGNVLTGAPVVQAAEQAILNTPGDIAEKLMAAMQAARSMGGDGRCSCNVSNPTGCGAPPPSFTKSAHIGLMIVSRPGDGDSPCTTALGCGAGQYWMDLNVANQPASAPDPVVQLQTLYNTWRAQQVGRPDHFRSTVTMTGTQLRANGYDTLTGRVVLRDAQGNPLGNSIPVHAALNPFSTVGTVVFGPAVPQPDGSYAFTMRGNLDTGTAIVDVIADDGRGRVRISPAPVIEVGDPFGACGTGAIGNGAGGVIDALRVAGSAGAGRIVDVGHSQPFVLTLDPPVGAPSTLPVGAFALWAHLGVPPPGAEFAFAGGGALCFTPWPLLPSAPTLLVADTFGFGGAIPAAPAPWAIGFPGVPAVLDVALQAVMIGDLQSHLFASNALMLRVHALPQPVITSVAPPTAAAGTPVTITGSGYFTGIELEVGGIATVPTAVTPTSVAFAMPSGVPCDSQVSLRNPGGTPVTAPINPSPQILAVPFTTGPAAGGTLYIIAGRNLLGTTVTFAGVPMTITSASATGIVGNTPPGTPGPALVVVRNAIGCQDTTTFTYQ
jgi:uncharacterized Ntn-hydrolase superfamily protein